MKKIEVSITLRNIVASWLIAAFTLSVVAVPCSNADASSDVPKPALEMYILSVSKRVGSPKRPTKAVITLAFHNFGPAPCSIAFEDLCIKPERPTSELDYSYYVAEDRPRACGNVGHSMSMLDYEWRNNAGLVVLSDTSDLAGSSKEVRPHNRVLVSVPIRIPNVSGNYKLLVHFDNRSLKSTDYHSSCCFQIDHNIASEDEYKATQIELTKWSYPGQFFDMSAEANVVLPERAYQ